MKQPKILEKYLPKPIVYHTAKAAGYRCPPMLVTFVDAQKRLRSAKVPL